MEVRVTSISADLVFVGRGSAAGVRVGDRVLLAPVGRPQVAGVVRGVTRNHARVELDLGGPALQGLMVGTPGQVFVHPEKKTVAPVGEEPLDPTVPGLPAAGAVERPPGASSEWTRPPEEWNEGMPLLAPSPATPGGERPAEWSGWWSLTGDWTRSELAGGRDWLGLRTGMGLTGRNAFGRGGRLHVQGDLFTRSADVGPNLLEDETRLRVSRLSYELGGRRGEATRLEFGRFFQHAVPEFGRLDGVEYGRRIGDGRALGLSLGHRPESRDSLFSQEDWQLGLNLSGGEDVGEKLDWRAAFQKTWHGGKSDRDLLFLDGRWAPGPEQKRVPRALGWIGTPAGMGTGVRS